MIEDRTGDFGIIPLSTAKAQIDLAACSTFFCVEFDMQKYLNADPTSMVSMMGDYYSILARYTEFAEKIDAFDESELTNAELAYYLEVTNRVSQKLLRVAG